jgi:hypothetical protein
LRGHAAFRLSSSQVSVSHKSPLHVAEPVNHIMRVER